MLSRARQSHALSYAVEECLLVWMALLARHVLSGSQLFHALGQALEAAGVCTSIAGRVCAERCLIDSCADGAMMKRLLTAGVGGSGGAAVQWTVVACGQAGGAR